MKKDYEVFLGSESVGRVQVQKQGLYYRFFCRCRVTGEVVYRLVACCGDSRENLGVVVPVEDGFGLETKVPVKRFGSGETEFRLMPRTERCRNGRFCPIYPEEPFSYISRLKEGFLAYQNGQAGLMLKD